MFHKRTKFIEIDFSFDWRKFILEISKQHFSILMINKQKFSPRPLEIQESTRYDGNVEDIIYTYWLENKN